MSSRRNLSERQRRFVSAYIGSLDPGAAAVAAGYSARRALQTGERLLSQRPIVEAIARRAGEGPEQDPVPQGSPITRQWITKELTELYRTVRSCLPGPGAEADKAPSGASLQSATKMLELLIKHLEEDGRDEGPGDGTGEPDLSRLSPDDLRQLEAILARTIAGSGAEGAGGAKPQ